MTDSARPDWIWLGNGAIDEFKVWRIRGGATTASAASYATGAHEFVRYCRKIERQPNDAIESFIDHLARASELSAQRSVQLPLARPGVRAVPERPARNPPLQSSDS